MKKLIVLNFIFILLLNAFLVFKEIFYSYYSGSRYEDFTYINTSEKGTFGFGVFRISYWWLIYFGFIALSNSYIYKFLKFKLKNWQTLIIIIILQFILCYLVDKLILVNIFGFFAIENVLISFISITLFWSIVIYKNKMIKNG